MILYIALKNGKPIINDEIEGEFDQLYQETGDILVRLVRDEVIGIWESKEDAELYIEHIKASNVFEESDKLTVGELHLVESQQDWN